MKLAAGVALCILFAGCQRERPADRPPLGAERGDCRPDKTCEPGLLCLSNLCVRPPPADCAAVSEQLTSIELGNYAEPEDRAPVVSRYAAACAAAYVTKEQGACILAARDRTAAARCAPLLFPAQAAGSGAADCDAVVTRMKAVMGQQSPYLNDANTRRWFERTLDVMRASCAEDHWPEPLKACLLADNLTAAAMATCNQQMPAAIQQAIQTRLSAAMPSP